MKDTAVDATSEPDRPTTVKLYDPGFTELDAVSIITVLVAEGFGENDAVTPDGRPVAENWTWPMNPKAGLTYMYSVVEEPWPSCTVL